MKMLDISNITQNFILSIGSGYFTAIYKNKGANESPWHIRVMFVS